MDISVFRAVLSCLFFFLIMEMARRDAVGGWLSGPAGEQCRCKTPTPKSDLYSPPGAWGGRNRKCIFSTLLVMADVHMGPGSFVNQLCPAFYWDLCEILKNDPNRNTCFSSRPSWVVLDWAASQPFIKGKEPREQDGHGPSRTKAPQRPNARSEVLRR